MRNGRASRFSGAICRLTVSSFFFFNDTATTEIYTLSLHDALPIFPTTPPTPTPLKPVHFPPFKEATLPNGLQLVVIEHHEQDRKSTRLNSSHSQISYAVFCLKKKSARARRAIRRASTPTKATHAST